MMRLQIWLVAGVLLGGCQDQAGQNAQSGQSPEASSLMTLTGADRAKIDGYFDALLESLRISSPDATVSPNDVGVFRVQHRYISYNALKNRFPADLAQVNGVSANSVRSLIAPQNYPFSHAYFSWKHKSFARRKTDAATYMNAFAVQGNERLLRPDEMAAFGRQGQEDFYNRFVVPLSPIEKFDLLLNNFNTRGNGDGDHFRWSKIFAESHRKWTKRPETMNLGGLCHASALISARFKKLEPGYTAVPVNNVNHQMYFDEGETAGIATMIGHLAFTYLNPRDMNLQILGNRCNTTESAEVNDVLVYLQALQNGVEAYAPTGCRPMNPATFFITMFNSLYGLRVPVIMDVERGSNVLNQVAYWAEFKELARDSAKKTVKLSMKVKFAKAQDDICRENCSLLTVERTYGFTLQLDSAERILGGYWHFNDGFAAPPEFIWTADHNVVTSLFDNMHIFGKRGEGVEDLERDCTFEKCVGWFDKNWQPKHVLKPQNYPLFGKSGSLERHSAYHFGDSE